MGLNNTKIKIHLLVSEIQEISLTNSSLQVIYNQHKNSNGILQITDLEQIFEKRLPTKIVKTLYKICSRERGKFNYEDFKYLYALFFTKNSDAKLNFIADLIFVYKSVLSLDDYYKKIFLIFGGTSNIYEKLSSNTFINNMTNNNKLTKENFLKNLDNQFKSISTEFCYFGENDNIIDGSKLILSSNNINHFQCECLKSFKGLNRTQTIAYNVNDNQKYDKMEIVFRQIERNNNGLFTITYFENILKELDVHKKLISLIVSYLKKKTQKSFLDFDNFKNLVSKLAKSYEELILQIFEIISFPKCYINKKDLFVLIKSFRPELDIKEINLLFDELKIIKNKVYINKFHDIFKLILDDISDSLEKMQYIPYLYFKIKTDDKMIEKNCIEILMKNNKDLRSYIQDIIHAEENTNSSNIKPIENYFYIVDLEFWVNWCDYTHWTSLEKVKLPVNTEIKDRDKNIKPRINTSQIADCNGKLNEGLVYFRDYIIITDKMYEMFSFWYINLGPQIKRSKIEFNRNDSNAQIQEIEVYPVFLKFLSFDDILAKISVSSQNTKKLSSIKEYLSNLTYADNSSKQGFYPFSRLIIYRDILKQIETSCRRYDHYKSRLWMFYQNKFYLVSPECSLETDCIRDTGIIICEVRTDKFWPSDYYFHNLDINCDKDESYLNSNTFSGIINIGNTCYMNSILQLFINNIELKDILLKENFEKCINYKNKNGANGLIISEFINILKEKWQDNSEKKIINPKKWKDIIDNINPYFKGSDQQDAYDYFNFMLDILHEEINLYSVTDSQIQNDDVCEDYESDDILANNYWANNLRRNASFIHSLYLGQLKSTLTCQNCNNSNISFETFTSLSIPIPQSAKINLEIIIFRLPFTFKVYYTVENANVGNDYLTNANSDFNKLDKNLQLKLLRKKSLDYAIDIYNLDESLITQGSVYDASINLQNKNEFKIGNLLNDEIPITGTLNSNMNTNLENIYMSRLNVNIPVRLKIEIERKEKVGEIISIVKKMKDLELEETEIYTECLIRTIGGVFVDKNLKIDDCFQNNQVLHIYELLNSNGFNKLFNYKYESDKNLKLSQEYVNAFSKDSCTIDMSLSTELFVQITHRVSKIRETFLFDKIEHSNLDTFYSLMILNNNKQIQVSHLYDYIWDKYEYFLNNPTQTVLWWNPQTYKNKKTVDCDLGINTPITYVKPCSPFVIKIINKNNKSCVACPWFKFCCGCVINPFKKDFLKIMPEHMIVVEWCSKIFKNDFNEMNLKLIINHPSVCGGQIGINTEFKASNGQGQPQKVSTFNIEDCLNLFTENEYLGDDKFYCQKCQEKTYRYKRYQIEKLPPYLVIILKRFKYSKMYRSKIDSMIDFPLNNLDLNNYKENTNNSCISHLNLYNLFGVVNHMGSLNSGHYISIIRNNTKWIKCDDSSFYEVDENSIRSNLAYMLIYKVAYSDDQGTDAGYKNTFNYLNILYNSIFDEEYIINTKLRNNLNSIKIIKAEKKVFIGEPVETSLGKGFVVSMFEYESIPFIKIKLKKGYVSMK